tara:strand:- start:37 stop:225 length:189 start_codon:yes stop_codon:yes gene_type:complete
MSMSTIIAIKSQIDALEAVLNGNVDLEHVINDIWRKPVYNTEDVNYSLEWLRAELKRIQSER